jgi:hypothetical protein
MTKQLAALRRLRWAVRATLTLAVGASVAANILHAQRNPISETIAGWPPLALLLTVELVSRVPMHRRLLAAVRVVATAVISGIAAWVSYWHMVGVAGRYGETDASPYLLPISVDGLIVVASISLVELAGRIRTAETPAEPAQSTVASPPAVPGPVVQVPTVEPVTAPDPPRASPAPAAVPARVDQLVPAPAPELVARARSVATAHRRTTGTDISVDQLAGYLRVPADTAGVLHGLVLNADAGNGHREPIGELTR